ncbi:hypothetical protein TVAG_256020 [Trichomonas vaginalis G3]|uniref:Uncharacterized protein n=1 Tax=Trichomonas vaginalis (strain ATCC PRA-98 / G3) TaxID=412133 RepID=A2DYZ9_TRIV3|nr:hypothetical protein TVAGG3_0869040 [Trichomonas vaginalis G3]EAY14410.1 hypothetical protein TVAG_256020 [Trichomonas vaginalis G3]KAI5501231.1 hypothetical protein TVAGG3_0869040 [Trichomonas vaginalis G3]|eukprot:XP_001326633.1 hypothetical protein [Trichomonas vaginalis G3]
MNRKVKGGHWSYFYIKRGLLEKSMYVKFNTTRKVSFYVGEGDHCPFMDSMPFYVSGPVSEQIADLPKLPATRKFPFAVRTDDDAIVQLHIYGKIGFGIYSTIFILIPGAACICALLYYSYVLYTKLPQRKKIHYSKKSRLGKR